MPAFPEGTRRAAPARAADRGATIPAGGQPFAAADEAHEAFDAADQAREAGTAAAAPPPPPPPGNTRCGI